MATEKMMLFVDKKPTCKKCPFYAKNCNQDAISAGKDEWECVIRSTLSTAQYGGVDIMKKKTYECPLHPFKDSTTMKKLNDRVNECRVKLGLSKSDLIP